MKPLNPVCRGNNHIFSAMPTLYARATLPENWREQWPCDCGAMTLKEWQERVKK